MSFVRTVRTARVMRAPQAGQVRHMSTPLHNVTLHKDPSPLPDVQKLFKEAPSVKIGVYAVGAIAAALFIAPGVFYPRTFRGDHGKLPTDE